MVEPFLMNQPTYVVDRWMCVLALLEPSEKRAAW